MNKKAFLMLGIMLLNACQAERPIMTIDQAKAFRADFKKLDIESPPRNITLLRRYFGDGQPVPTDCDIRRKKAADKTARTLTYVFEEPNPYKKNVLAATLAVDAEQAMNNGQFQVSLEILNRAIVSSVSGFRRAVFYNQLARLHARLGDIASAERARSNFERTIGSAQRVTVNADPNWMQKAKKVLRHIVAAEIAQTKNELALAEYNYREAIDMWKRLVGHIYVDVNELGANLARVLLSQRRLAEAEAAARTSIHLMAQQKSGMSNYITYSYNGTSASPIIAMASVLLEQGRSDDAVYLAEIGVNMHEVGCSEPSALGLMQARRTLIDALAEKRDWHGVLEQVERARIALEDYPELFERVFESSLSLVEAELRAGDPSKGRKIAGRLLADLKVNQNQKSYRFAEILSLLALADSETGAVDQAIDKLKDAFPVLVSTFAQGTQGTAAGSRRSRIIDDYMDLLKNTATKDDSDVNEAIVASEMLRVAAASRSNRVGVAATESNLRAAVNAPALAALVRQEQELALEYRSITDQLAYLTALPDVSFIEKTTTTLRERIGQLDSARQVLREHIVTSFPYFAELASPKPLTIPEIQSFLSPDQVMVTYHLGEASSYVWAIRNAGAIAFAELSLESKELAARINLLREAVYPGGLRTLSDVPRFDLALAHKLYKILLMPVRQKLDGAREMLIVADGPVGSLPFSMLVSQPPREVDDDGLLFSGYRQAAWLVRDLAVSNLPGIESLRLLEKLQASGDRAVRSFVGFGDPYFNADQAANARNEELVEVASRSVKLRNIPRTRAVNSADLSMLPRLPDTREEIMAISNSLGADPSRDLFLGEAANEENVKSTDLSSYKVISFATHGLVPGDLNGLTQPALAMTNPAVSMTDGDGLLTMNEILGLKLQADIAVLSACNTAAADRAGAEAVSGLGRAFFFAGARALLVSNWPVHSTSTTDFMSVLFRSISNQPGLPVSSAIQRTKIYQIDESVFENNERPIFSYAHPIFWAPFTLVGDGS